MTEFKKQDEQYLVNITKETQFFNGFGCFSENIMPTDSGRKKDSAWLEVSDVENDKNKCMCKSCDQLISKKIERIREHLKKCRAQSKKKDQGSIFLLFQEIKEN